MVSSDETEVAILTRSECLEHLSRASIGRVGASINALPVILPVHFTLFEDSVLFRTTTGTKLDAAIIGAVIAFQADSYEPVGGTGWSVLFQGIATVVNDSRATSVPIKPWGPTHSELHLVRVEATHLTGRRFGVAGDGPRVAFPDTPSP